MLHGEIDDWTPFQRCQQAVAAIVSPLITQHGYPGPYHDFDVPVPVHVMDNVPTSQNAGMNPAAREDAPVRVPAFIDSLPAP